MPVVKSHRRVIGLAAAFGLALALTLTSAARAASPNAAQVFTATGTVASAGLGSEVINGTTYLLSVIVSQDPATGATRLMLLARALYGSGGRTQEYLIGTIPAADFSVAPDLSTATLSTVVSSTPTDFTNPDVGPIVNLAIDLTWSAYATGHLVATDVYDWRDTAEPRGFTHEVDHVNGPLSDCLVNGFFAGAPVANASGTLEEDASRTIYQTK